MKTTNLFGLGALVAMAALPVMAEEVDRTIDAAADGHVSIANTAGSVTVNGWSRDQVEVKGELGRNVEELVFESSGDGVRIHVKVPKNNRGGIASDLYIQVPQGSSLDVATVSADIDVMKVQGDQKLETVSGDIDTEAYEADISANVVSGDIQIRGQGADTQTRVGTVSGDLELSRISGVIEGGTVTGDLVIDEGSFDRAILGTVNGEVIFRSELRNGGTLEAEAVNGEIILQFDGSISGRFEFDTLNGDIDNCFGPEPKRTSKYTPGWSLRFQEGDGSARVSASTVNGDISICR